MPRLTIVLAGTALVVFFMAGSASAQSGDWNHISFGRAFGMQGRYAETDKSSYRRHEEMRQRMAAKRKASPAVIAAKGRADAKAAKLAQLETRAGS